MTRLTSIGAVVGATAVVTALMSPPPAVQSAPSGEGWSATWTSAMQRPEPSSASRGQNWSEAGFAHQSLRQVVRVSAGGGRLRIRLSNLYGAQPLRVDDVSVAATRQGASVVPGTARAVTFHRARADTIASGSMTASDPVDLPVSPLESLTVTVYVAGATGPATFHEDGITTSYRADGDHALDTAGAAYAGETSHSYYYLTGVDVLTGRPGSTVVAFGDSITNGHNSTVDGNDRYTDALADRLALAHRRLAVANTGISGNTLLNELACFGEKGITRFQRDALDQPGVRTVILLEGANDIWDSEGTFGDCGETPRITADQLITGYRTLIAAAHARGVRIIGVTIIPFKAPYLSAPDFQRAEAIRHQVNDWILTSGEFDSVVDAARAVADPADSQQLDPAFNSGDFLHPNDAGYQAIADAFDLNAL